MRQHPRSSSGFSLIEVVVAALCLALILAAVSTLFVNGNDSSLAAQRQAMLSAAADRQIAALRQAVKTSGFSALAMSSLPAAGAGATLTSNPNTHTDPNDFAVTKTGCGSSNAELLIENNFDNTSEGTSLGSEPAFSGCDSGAEPLIVQAGGLATPSQSVSVGGGTATVDTYVTQTNVGCNTSLGSCGNDARRVVVAVVPSAGAADQNLNSPIYVSTIFTNPLPSNAPNGSIGITLGVNLG